MVKSTKPLLFQNVFIDDFWIRFEHGKVVSFDAREGKEMLQKIIETDEGSHFLGEIAFVDFDSKINQSGIIFENTLYDENASNKKAQDLQRRCDMINDEKPLMTISIHQNSYTSPEIRGAQVFYYTTSSESQKLAETIQKTLIEQVDPENHREAKANDSYYLLKKTDSVIVIVECGFLSNPQEAEKLADEEYQQKMADAICIGVSQYLGSEGNQKNDKTKFSQE